MGQELKCKIYKPSYEPTGSSRAIRILSGGSAHGGPTAMENSKNTPGKEKIGKYGLFFEKKP